VSQFLPGTRPELLLSHIHIPMITVGGPDERLRDRRTSQQLGDAPVFEITDGRAPIDCEFLRRDGEAEMCVIYLRKIALVLYTPREANSVPSGCTTAAA
jgi:hypothetical protein